MGYVQVVSENRAAKKRIILLKGVDDQPVESKFPHNPERYVFNLSDVNLSNTDLEVLSLGMKFCDVKNNDNQMEFETEFESLGAQIAGLSLSSDKDIEGCKALLVNACYE